MKTSNKLRVLRTKKGFSKEKIADLLQIPHLLYPNPEKQRKNQLDYHSKNSQNL